MAVIDPVLADLVSKADMDTLRSDIPMPEQPSMSMTKFYFFKFMEELFCHTLCCIPEGRVHCWWYNVTGKVSSYFHCKTCDKCKGRFKGWWK